MRWRTLRHSDQTEIKFNEQAVSKLLLRIYIRCEEIFPDRHAPAGISLRVSAGPNRYYMGQADGTPVCGSAAADINPDPPSKPDGGSEVDAPAVASRRGRRGGGLPGPLIAFIWAIAVVQISPKPTTVRSTGPSSIQMDGVPIFRRQVQPGESSSRLCRATLVYIVSPHVMSAAQVGYGL